MIDFQQVSFTYPGAARPAFSAVSLHVPAGQFALLIGPSGAGKSTLLRCINGLVPHFSGGHLTGQLRVAGRDPVAATPQIMSRHVGFVFQDPESQFVMDRVEDEIAFVLENAALPPHEMRVRVEEILDLLDLAPLRRRPLNRLSGGERQRVAIASALVLRPEILVLDEPTSQLDPKSAEDVLTTLVRLNTDLGLTIVLAEHRLERVLPFADALVYLPAGGEGVQSGDARDLLRAIDIGPPLVTLARVFDWRPLPLSVKEARTFSRRLLDTLNRAPGAAGSASLDPGKALAESAHLHQTTSERSSPPAVSATQLTYAYDAEPVLRGVSLAVAPGEIVALMGRNGSGKSTLLKSLVGLVRPARGKVMVSGNDIAGRPVAEICRQVGYLPQDPNSLLFADSVYEELMVTLRNHQLHPEQTGVAPPVDPDALLATLKLEAKRDAYPRDLSVGERQRVALGAVMITKPAVLLLDEPTRGLDYAAKQLLVQLLHNWRDDGMAILLVTHDVELAALAAGRVIILSEGEVIADGAPGAVMGSSPFFSPQVAKLFPQTGWLTVADVLAHVPPAAD